MRSITCWKLPLALAAGWCALAFPPSLAAQDSAAAIVTVTPHKAAGKQSGVLEARIGVRLRAGYHVNSNKPEDEFLIPLQLKWEAPPLEVIEVVYPKPKMEKYEFADKPMSVYSGEFEILTRLKVPKTAPAGLGALMGKLRYQACTENLCLPPKTVDIRLPYTIQ